MPITFSDSSAEKTEKKPTNSTLKVVILGTVVVFVACQILKNLTCNMAGNSNVQTKLSM